MPSSKAALTAKIAELEAELRTSRAETDASRAESLVLRMELDSREAVISYQNGGLDEMGRVIDRMAGGMVAELKSILARHGVTFRPEQKTLS